MTPTIRLSLSAAGLSLIGILLASSCSHLGGPARPRNVIFILVDTLRADHLGAYGYAQETSPNLDAFAGGSVLFRNARSQASCTFPSVNSILTSRAPAAFLGQPNLAMGFPQQIPSLAEILRQRGYRTAAISSSAVVRKTPSRFNPGGGYERGFDVFREECLGKPASCVNQQAFEQLRREAGDEAPLFLYLHYLDPHSPYSPPKDYTRRFAWGQPEKAYIRDGDPDPIGEMMTKGADPGVTRADMQHLMNLYDDEIAYLDGQLLSLFRHLEEGGWLDDSIVVFTSDHGEEFLEHGYIKHCLTVFDNEVKVPLFLHLPGVEGRAVEQPVQSLDIVPTLLDYLGVPAAGLTLEGESLRPLIEDGKAGDPYQYSLAGPYRSVADGRFKLIQNLDGKEFRLFDLKWDAGETKDVLAAERTNFHRLRDALGGWLTRTEGGRPDESLRKSREAEQKLRSLGYLQ